MSWAWVEVKPNENDLLYSGHLACQGCGATIAARLALKALGPKTVFVIPASCWSVIDGAWPQHALQIPVFHTAFETAAIAATGIRAALDMKGMHDVNVVAWAGDGGTFDIGLQALSGAAERNENIIYVTYDNEAYMNTGIQRSSSTPVGAWTTTTPDERPEDRPKKNMMEILAAHRVPYAATASIAFPDDFISKLKKASQIRGFRFIHVFSPCPPGWKMASHLSVRIARLAVETKIFPLYEIEDGELYTITHWPKGLPVEEYFKLQGRFRPVLKDPERLSYVQRFVEHQWESLVRKHEATHGYLPEEARRTVRSTI